MCFALSDIFERWWARSIRSDENVSEDHAREWSCHKVSSLVFFSVLGVFLSVFFCISLSFLRRARARCVSLSLFLSPPTTHQGGEDFGDVLDDDDENHETSERMRWCTKRSFELRSESWTDAFLFVSTLNKACVGKKRKERERIDFRWRWWWEMLMFGHSFWNQRDWLAVIWAKRYISLVY